MTSNEQNTQVDTQSQEITRLQEELKTTTARAQYLAADFDTFRKRAEKERLEVADATAIRILSDLLEIVDTFDRAFAELQLKPELVPYVTGFELVYQSLKKLVSQYGVEEVPAQVPFDPAVHEAITQVPAEGKQPGDIVTVFQKGYWYKGRLLRPARVSVAQ